MMGYHAPQPYLSSAQPPQFALMDSLDLPADVLDKICRENAERLFWGGK